MLHPLKIGVGHSCSTSHFKMNTILSAIQLVSKNCFFASIDLKDAFFSVPVNKDHQKLLECIWKGKIYKFTFMPHGYSDSMRVFNKLMKPPFLYSRTRGFISVIYLDDSLVDKKGGFCALTPPPHLLFHPH